MVGALKSTPIKTPANDFPPNQDLATLAAIGQLASKVAHELNNPLDGVIRYISLAQRRVKEGETGADKHVEDVARYLEDAQFGLQRMAEVLRELLDFGRQAAPASPTTALHYLVEQSVQALHPLAEAHGVVVHCELSTPPSLRVPANLFQVLTNLLKNALDAMPRGGEVFISTSLDASSGELPRLIICVRDTGPGIPAEDLPHIFQPFFSRKPATADIVGTGLGLAISKEIVERMNGIITVEKRAPHTGCQFTLHIPLGAEVFAAPQDAAPVPHSYRGRL